MTELRVCPECNRHIRQDESACPFCSESKGHGGAHGPLRKALVVGAIAGASALGCGDSKPVVDDPSNKGDSVQVGQSDAMAASPVDTDPNENELENGRRTRQSDPNMPPMPYGAPPMRKRLV